MAGLTLIDIRKAYGDIEVLHGINLEIQSGEFIVFVGPSGCGKSTLLRTIAGLEDISSGQLNIDGDPMNEVPPSKRGIAMVFQSYALYPHMSVYDNMAFGLRISKTPADEIERRVRDAAEILQLTTYLDRLPKALSGGQRQRVAIGRSIVRDPKVFLFDEPLSNLDAALRVATRIEIAKLKESMPDATMIYVTHDQVEAMTLASRIVVLRDGNVEQVGTPMELYHTPANLFVARFIGSPAMNMLPATIDTPGGQTAVSVTGGGKAIAPVSTVGESSGARVQLGVRPEDLDITEAGNGLTNGVVDIVESLGEVTQVYVTVEGADEPVIAKLSGDRKIERGSEIALIADQSALHLFHMDGMAFARQ